ncbi:hypothetical protein [Comamonas testosteroni]|uniref:hypothetical protein n=1 Tax=Comamonas testosteroni TaxID=285 RepID=UPI0006B95AD1|nr:hypothetical protein [Comamonas testosteroni]
MFATIETKGATHIVIHIPHEGADKSLPALARLLEQNAVFVKAGWHEFTTVNPEMNITLGNVHRTDGVEGELLIAESSAVIGEDFAIAAPGVFVSNAAALKKERDENSRLRSELDHTRNQLARANEQIKALTEVEEAA